MLFTLANLYAFTMNGATAQASLEAAFTQDVSIYTKTLKMLPFSCENENAP